MHGSKTTVERWSDDIKDMLRRENGAGWRLREHSGKAQLTQLLEREGQKRKSGDLGIEWSASNQTEILNVVVRKGGGVGDL